MTDNAKLVLSYMHKHKAEKNNSFYFVDLLSSGASAAELERCLSELCSGAYIDADTTYPQTVYSIL